MTLINAPATIDTLLPGHYRQMLQNITENYPALDRDTRNFRKTQSQFMDFCFTVSQPTELRSLRQMLAEIEKSKQALDEAFFGLRKKQVEIKRKQRELARATDELEREMLEVEIGELQSQISNTMGYVEGAIRRVDAYMRQYQGLLQAMGKESFSEEDFEADEERYHIMKAFEQALCAARARGGIIDEGNHIYFYQIGISGAMAQKEVHDHLASEGRALLEGREPPHSYEWLQQMAGKYAGCARKYAQNRRLILAIPEAMHRQ